MAYVTRYTLAAVKESGMRRLMLATQGRYTWATPEGALEYLKVILSNNTPAVILEHYGADPAVVQVKCYADHFDPVGVWFEESDIITRGL